MNKLLLLLFPLLYGILIIVLTNSTSNRLVNFYANMVKREKTRRAFTQVVLFLLLLYHYLYTQFEVADMGILLSTILIMMLYRFKFSDTILQFLHKNRTTVIVALGVGVGCCFVHSLFTLGVTIMTLTLSSLIYPSELVIRKWSSEGMLTKEEFMSSYFTLRKNN